MTWVGVGPMRGKDLARGCVTNTAKRYIYGSLNQVAAIISEGLGLRKVHFQTQEVYLTAPSTVAVAPLKTSENRVIIYDPHYL